MQDDIHEIEIDIAEAKKLVAFGDAIRRLTHNKDFQTVIDDGYTTKEARRLTLLLGDPNLENKAPVVASLQAIGELHQYLRVQLSIGDEMLKTIQDGEQFLLDRENAEETEVTE